MTPTNLSPQPDYQAERTLQLAKLKRQAQSQPTPGGGEAVAVFEFRGASLEIQTYRLPEWIISGPSETSKTTACLALVDFLAREYPGAQGAILRKVHKDLHSTVVKDFKNKIKRGDVTAYGGEKPEWFDYPNGSRIWCGGLDRPGAFLSGALDFVYVNQAEEITLEDWETLTTRTTGRAGVIVPGLLFGDANPGPPTHWIKNRETLKLFESRHKDNPTLFTADGEITERGKITLATLNKLTGVRKERLLYGRWVAAEGVVYDGYDAAVHILDYNSPQFPYPAIPADWRRIRSIDFGFTHPFVCGWFAVDPDGRMYLYRQIYMTQRTVKVHAAQINALSEGESIEQTVADHDAEDRATLEENGIYTIPAVKDISPGIQAVQERFKVADDGKARLFIMRDSLVERDESLAEARKPTCLEQELDVYSWPKSKDGKPVKEVPVKIFDDACDMTRYAVKYVGEMENFGSLFYD